VDRDDENRPGFKGGSTMYIELLDGTESGRQAYLAANNARGLALEMRLNQVWKITLVDLEITIAPSRERLQRANAKLASQVAL